MKNVKIKLTLHAHTQYCSRVEPVDILALEEICQNQLQTGDYGHRKKEFICLGSIWWVYQIKENTMHLVTCYGRSNIDMPSALRWAARNHDRINLQESI